jgi:Mrp family chromosome partitioning ATPase
VRVAIASGKGGTGKPAFATNLAVTAAVAGLDSGFSTATSRSPTAASSCGRDWSGRNW